MKRKIEVLCFFFTLLKQTHSLPDFDDDSLRGTEQRKMKDHFFLVILLTSPEKKSYAIHKRKEKQIDLEGFQLFESEDR
jgi:hypothetical protein